MRDSRRSSKELICRSCSRVDVRRRDFLRVGSLGLLGISLSQYLELAAAMTAKGQMPGGKGKAQACILLWLEGGPSQVDTWDPKPTSNFKPISTNVPGIQISELFPSLARQMDKLSIIRSMHSLDNNHPQGTHYAMTAHRPNPAMNFPSLGSIITKEMGPRNNVPPYLIVPKPWELDFDVDYADSFKASFIGDENNPMILPDPSQEDFRVPDLRLPKSLTAEEIEDRRSFLNLIDRRYREKEQMAEFAQMDGLMQQAWKMILSPAVRNAFDLSQESEKTKEAYGRDRVGQSVLLARRLVEAGCRFVTAAGYKHGEWDTHGKNDERLRDKLAPLLDRSLSALLEDLDQRGMLESTVVIALGEFGRTVHINAQVGRDHWPDCWSLLMAGGGIQGGQVVGVSDERGAQVAERMVTVGDVFATIYKALGIDWTKTYIHPTGRPLYIANSLDDKMGQPVRELI